MLFGVISLGSLGFAIYVRIQPPTIIRVDKDGDATVVGASSGRDPAAKLAGLLSAEAADVSGIEFGRPHGSRGKGRASPISPTLSFLYA